MVLDIILHSLHKINWTNCFFLIIIKKLVSINTSILKEIQGLSGSNRLYTNTTGNQPNIRGLPPDIC